MQYDPLDKDSDMGHRLYNTCNRLPSQFETKFRRLQRDPLVRLAQKLRMRRRHEAGILERELGDGNLDGDFFYDWVGIQWMHLGRWGEDHPCENLGDPIWDVAGAIHY
ncbi:hypothetical protein PV328_012118, partial [Microctonus aethiopoides]